MAAAKRTTPATSVVAAEGARAIKHSDKRVNNPTADALDLITEEAEEVRDVTYRRVPWIENRDRALDPQLVWTGKDEADRADLTVTAPPIFRQERIDPQYLINQLIAETRKRKSEDEEGQTSIFDLDGAFDDGIPDPLDKVDWYHHQMDWTNRMILGDSLQVMASLAERESLRGKVQMIYIDPPYGIKFNSNWQVSTVSRDVKDGNLASATREVEQIKAFRDTWKLGINTYLSYLRDRLVVARDLLTESGSVFVQIGDENVHLVRSLLDEVFGPTNFITLATVKKTTTGTGDFLAGVSDYVLWYAKNRDSLKFRQTFRIKAIGGDGAGAYGQLELTDGSRRPASRAERDDVSLVPTGARFFRPSPLTSDSVGREKGEGAASWFPVLFDGKEYRPSIKVRWKTNEDGMSRLKAANRLVVTGNTLNYVRYLDDFPAFPVNNIWEDTQSGSGMDKLYVVQTNTKVIERCMLMATDPGDLVLDPTCGSGTTAYIAEQWGRRWITIDTSRVALALARHRIMGAKYPVYLLADSPEGKAKEAELNSSPPDRSPSKNDVRRGFVYVAGATHHAQVDREQPRHQAGHVS